MRHETPRRPRAIKRDPEHSASPNARLSHTMAHSTADTNASSDRTNIDPSTRRFGRSDAPTPSEPEPLLREMRVANHVVNVGSPTANEETLSFQTSFQDFGKTLKACNDTLGELQGLGISHDVPLPELVLVGDQSAGKSSVMSGLANLELPRSEGTCTRCPLHIRVSRNTDWSCRVSLAKEYKYSPPSDGREISEADVTDEDPFFPWKRLASSEILEFKTVHDKSQIEEVLRWAQIAILSDDKPHDLFIPGIGDAAVATEIDLAAAECTAKFSPNVVSLEIKGPGLPNLSFYDLPGMFQNPADARDDYLVNVVRNLSKSYINRQSAIIMCSIPMNTDAENSYTFGLIRRLRATPRTIGVLTKADLLPQGGAHEQWLAIMNGTAHQTGEGYFITSRPTGKDLEELRLWEENVFEDHGYELWPTHFHKFGNRCGVEKLKKFLSEKLGGAFLASLPQIENKVKVLLNQNKKKLANLPELPDNIELEIHRSLTNFNTAAQASIDNFTRHFNLLPKDFKECLLFIKPKFILWDKSDCPILEISDDDDDDEPSSVATPSKRPRQMPPPQTPAAKRHRGLTPAQTNSGGSSFVKPEDSDGHGRDSPVPRPLLRPASQPTLPLQPPFEQFSKIGKSFRTLAQVREEIDSKTKAGLPQRNPDEVYEDLAIEAIKPWKAPMDTFLSETVRRLKKDLFEALLKSFDSLKKRHVYREVRKHLDDYLKAHSQDTAQLLAILYKHETHRLMTFNDEAFAQYKSDELHLLTRFRHKMRMEKKGLQDPRPLADWDKMSDSERDKERSRRLSEETNKIGKDPFAREVDVISYVRGYYKLAALRFADAVAQQVLCQMIPNIQSSIHLHLIKELGIAGPNSMQVYEKLMEEDPQMAETRQGLKREQAKFEKALASIDALKMDDSQGRDAASVNMAADVSMDDADDGGV